MLPAFVLAFQALPAQVLPAAQPILLNVDATAIDRNVVRVSETFPTASGKRAFYFPKFIPGEHRASGPINGLVSLHFFAGGKEIDWDRDPVELFRFVVDVPKGASSVEARFTVVSEPSDNATPNLARIKWNRVLLYPDAGTTDRILVLPKITPPAGWRVASALTTLTDGKPVSVTELIDSPVIVGHYAQSYELGSIDGASVGMDVMAEQDGYQIVPDAALAKARELVRQEGAAYRGRHFRRYRFLVTLSGAGAGAGLEHHESSEDGSGLAAAQNDAAGWGELLAHEFNHSWNGKFRRPAGLATPDFHKPMDGSGLWVYEGLTQYMGYVFAARSGFSSPEVWQGTWANLARGFEAQPGRAWRPVVDTARSVGLVRGLRSAWSGEVRGTDYYTEGALVWLEADCIIREGTKGAKSLDDFLRRFFGGTTDAPVVKPYTTEEVVRELNTVYPYDWAGFLHERIDRVHLSTPSEALEKAGFRLVPGAAPVGRNPRAGTLPMLGLIVGRDGTVSSVWVEGPAFRAGLGTGMTITKLDGKEFSYDELLTKVTTPNPGTLQLTVTGGRSFSVPYVGAPIGARLEAIPGKTDWLNAIAKPLP